MRFRKHIGRALVAGGVAVLVVLGVGSSPALATTGAPTLFSRNASDPWMYPCFTSTFSGWCVYTSSDLNQGGASTYPMSQTFAYTWDGTGNPGDPAKWVDRGVALNESQYGGAGGWVATNNNHLWAPNATYGPDFNMYLYVPDTTADKYSHVGVSTSASPWGPFTYAKQVTFNGANITNQYMSDPFAFQSMGDHPNYPDPARLNTSAHWLYWANGDFDTTSPNIACGGISGALLDDATMSEIYDNDNNLSNNELSISGISGALGTCGSKGRPYLEGPDMYFTNFWGFAFGPNHDRPYMLVMSAKPAGGTHGASNQVIAYASASSPLGPFTYEGILLDASSSTWTTQASIAVDSGGPGGATRFLLIYHDDSGGTNHNRKTYMTCLTFDLSDGKFVPATRPSSIPDLSQCSATRP